MAGELPTPAEARKFLADTAPDKRAKKIDELLTRPGHAALWTLRFCDMLKATDWSGFGIHLAPEREAPRFQTWVRAQIDANTPYDPRLPCRSILARSRPPGRVVEPDQHQRVPVAALTESAADD